LQAAEDAAEVALRAATTEVALDDDSVIAYVYPHDDVEQIELCIKENGKLVVMLDRDQSLRLAKVIHALWPMDREA
jgi:hypothetical protein